MSFSPNSFFHVFALKTTLFPTSCGTIYMILLF
nr:MAG TPA: hypothetical protein [Caudoviricetes sp.]